MSLNITIDLDDLRKNREAALAFIGFLRTLLLGDAVAIAAGPAPGDVRYRRRDRVATRPTMSWDAFLETLSSRTVAFIDLVREAGMISLPVVAERMGLPPKALGGLTGAMQRKAGNRDVVVPIQVGVDANGDRTWTWVGDNSAAGVATDGVAFAPAASDAPPASDASDASDASATA